VYSGVGFPTKYSIYTRDGVSLSETIHHPTPSDVKHILHPVYGIAVSDAQSWGGLNG
jgi:hypothetical protein